MKRQQITFLLAGLITGLICVIFGSFESPEIAIVALTYGVGPLFFTAIVAGVVTTGARRYFRPGFLRYLAGLFLSIITYMVALIAFFAVYGFSRDWIGFRQSGDIVDFGIDIWLALVVAGAVGASGIALLTALLTGKWSNSLLVRLMLAGLVTILVTFIVNLPFHSYWSFLGVLLPVGNALFCWLVGAQIWKNSQAARDQTASAPTV